MDLDALREALDQHRDGVAGVHQYDELAIAARAVLDSEEADWCETHDEPLLMRFGAWHFVGSDCKTVRVSMVRVRLLAEEPK